MTVDASGIEMQTNQRKCRQAVIENDLRRPVTFVMTTAAAFSELTFMPII